MSKNKLYDLKYYNEDQKKRYLKTVADNETQYWLCARILGRVSRAEEMFDKDLYDFSFTQIERFLFYLNPSKLNTSRMNVYAVNNYIEWAISQDLSKTNINTLNIMMSEDYYKGFIDESKQTIFSEEEIEDMVNESVNPIDKVIFQLLFEGISGSECEELLNLQRKNIDFDNNRLLLTESDGSIRILEVSEKCMVLISSALEQTVYLKSNGLYEGARGPSEIDLISNNFVVRGIVSSRTDTSKKADKFLIYRRLKALAKPDIFDKPYLTTKNIQRSALLKIAKDYHLKNETFGDNFWKDICKRFNLTEATAKSYKKDFLNIETVNKIYFPKYQ